MHYRQLELSRLNKTADLKLTLTYLIDRNNESEMKICVPGELFTTVDLERLEIVCHKLIKCGQSNTKLKLYTYP